MRRLDLIGLVFVVLLAVSVLGAPAVQVAAQTNGAGDPLFVKGEPRLAVDAPDNTMVPGATNEVGLQVSNDGRVSLGSPRSRDIVTAARNVRVELEGDGPFEIETNRQSIGTVTESEPRPLNIAITVPEDAEPGEYELGVKLRYRHTSTFSERSGVTNERSRTVTRTVDVEIADEPRFEITGVSTDAQIGGSGTVKFNLTNVGTESASAIDVGLEATSPYVSFAEFGSDVAHIDRLDIGETTMIGYDVTVRERAPIRMYSFDGTVRFTDSDGERSSQTDLSAGFSPLDEQRFEVSIEDSTLRVGEPGVIRGQITNEGPGSAEGVTVELGEAQLDPRSRSYAVGDLDLGESADIRFRATVPHEADAVPQRIDLTTRYRMSRDHDRTSTEPVRVPVSERRDAITVSAIEPRFAAGESGALLLELRNQRETEVRDLRVTLEVDDPLESDFRSTVIPSLAPGEADRIAFDLEVDSDAPVSRYPATVGVEYLDENDEAATVRPAIVAVEVTEADDEFSLGIDIVLFVLLMGLVIAAFVWLYRR